MKTATDKAPLPQVDWPAYWERFKEVHGGNPVEHGGRLLFQDGWTYARSDHAGPEWPPPADPRELAKLQRAYWRIRLRIVTKERDLLRALCSQLRTLQDGKSAPLQQRIRFWDDALGQHRSEVRDIDLRAIEQGRLAWLEEDVAECRKKLDELTRKEQHNETPAEDNHDHD